MKLTVSSRPREATFDLTPMIDVVLLLIIFFCLTSQFSGVRVAPVDLPRERGDAAGPQATATLVLDIDAEGHITVGGRRCEVDDLPAHLAPQSGEGETGPGSLDVIIRADRRCRSGRLDEVLQSLATAGVRRWKLATAPSPGAG